MAESKVKPAFDRQVVILPVDAIVPQRELVPEFRKTTSFKRISASIEHVGLIEPLVVYPRGPRDYLLLDGHARLDVLKPRFPGGEACCGLNFSPDRTQASPRGPAGFLPSPSRR